MKISVQTMFSLTHHHGNMLREGWKNLLDCLLTLFLAKLLPECMVEVRPTVPSMNVVKLGKKCSTCGAEKSLKSGRVVQHCSALVFDVVFLNHKHSLMFNHSTALRFCSSDLPVQERGGNYLQFSSKRLYLICFTVLFKFCITPEMMETYI